MKVVEKGRTAELKCQAIGQPTPIIIWVKDGLELNVDENPRYTTLDNGKCYDILEITVDSASYGLGTDQKWFYKHGLHY